MQDWDRLVMVILGAGVAFHHGREGWRAWTAGEGGAAAGSFLLAAAAVAMPVVLAILGH